MTGSDDSRRRFFQTLAAAPMLPAAAQTSQPFAPFNAIQMGPHTMLDEGIERCLDLIQETAGINALMIYSHTYHGDIRKPPQFLATDHGVPPREMRNRKLPAVWVRLHEQYFKNTTLRHQIPDASYEYAARDLFQEVQEPARKRGDHRGESASRQLGRDAHRASEEIKAEAKKAEKAVQKAGKDIRQGWNEEKHDVPRPRK